MDKTAAASELKHAIREVRLAETARADGLSDLREMEQARLMLLRDGLEGLVRDLPEGHDDFSFAILPGDPPRLWIDATTFVVMGRDRRTYRLVKEARIGRSVLAETPSVEAVRQAVTRYVAERIVNRERALEDDFVLARRAAALREGEARPPGARNAGVFWGVVGFLLGMAAGASALFAYARVSLGVM